MELQNYLHIFAKRWKFIVVGALLMLGAAAVSTRLTTPIY